MGNATDAKTIQNSNSPKYQHQQLPHGAALARSLETGLERVSSFLPNYWKVAW